MIITVRDIETGQTLHVGSDGDNHMEINIRNLVQENKITRIEIIVEAS